MYDYRMYGLCQEEGLLWKVNICILISAFGIDRSSRVIPVTVGVISVFGRMVKLFFSRFYNRDLSCKGAAFT